MDVVPTDTYTTRFDYSQLPDENAAIVAAAADGIRKAFRYSILEIGKHLVAAKNVMPHGVFQAWAQTELDIPPRSASRYMQAAVFLEGKSATVAELPPTIIYELASSKVAPEIVAEVVAAAEAGSSTVEVQQRLHQAKRDAFEISILMKRAPKLTPEKAKTKLATQRAESRLASAQWRQEQIERQEAQEQARRVLAPLAERMASALGEDGALVLEMISNARLGHVVVDVLERTLRGRA